jgi:hypothetical protein
MTKEIKSVVARNISEIEKAISQKTSEVDNLKQDLQNYKSVLALLNKSAGNARSSTVSNGHRATGSRTDLRSVLEHLPENFSSSDFVKAAAGKKKDPRYLRQTLVRWAAQGRLKRMECGRYHKTRKAHA